jgi:hypothetical protein
VVICSQLPDNANTSVTNMAEHLAAEVIEEHSLPTPLVGVDHYPEHRGKPCEYSLVRFSCWERREVRLGGVWRYRMGSPNWSPSWSEEVEQLTKRRARGRALSSAKLLKLPDHRKWTR